MGRPGPQTFAKRQREIAKREKRRLKREKMAARRAERKAEAEGPDGETPLAEQQHDNPNIPVDANDDPDIDWGVRASMLGTDTDDD